MKRLIYSLLAAGAVAGLASCSADEPTEVTNSNDGTVDFTVTLPEIDTRAYGDASTINCNELWYTVYAAADNSVVISDRSISAFGKGVLSADVSLKLVANEQYNIVFYAHNSESGFSTYSNGKISVNYGEANTNDELDDAFCTVYNFTADGKTKHVILNRPFAQINVGTDDLDQDAVKAILSEITGTLTIDSGLYNSYDILNNKVTGEVTEAVSYTNDHFSVNSNFPAVSNGKSYSLLTEAYLLVPNTEALINAGYSLMNASVPIRDVNLAATPVQMNYRTNIYGSLLTSEQPFTVVIEPAFEAPAFELPQVFVSNADELVSALKNPVEKNVVIPSGTIIDLGDRDKIVLTSDKSIKNEGVVVNSANTSIRVASPGVTLNVEGGEFSNTNNSLFMFVTSDGGILNIKNTKITSELNNNGVAVAVMNDATVTLENVTIDSNFCPVQTWEGLDGSTVTAKNCTFISRSQNTFGNWTYCFNINGKNEATLTNCTVLGVQGAVAANSGAAVTLNNVTAATFVPANATQTVTFYPIYTADGAKVTVNGGYYYSENPSNYNAYQGANSSIIINSGYFNAMPYDAATKKELAPAAGSYKTVSVSKSIATPWGDTTTVTFAKAVSE